MITRVLQEGIGATLGFHAGERKVRRSNDTDGLIDAGELKAFGSNAMPY